MTADDFRDIALGMQDAVEREHMNHPDFRANGKIFATLDAQETSGCVKLSPDEQGEFMREHPQTFSPARGAWGRQGWTNVSLAPADAGAVRGAVGLAWQGVAKRARKPRGSPTRSRP